MSFFKKMNPFKGKQREDTKIEVKAEAEAKVDSAVRLIYAESHMGYIRYCQRNNVAYPRLVEPWQVQGLDNVIICSEDGVEIPDYLLDAVKR